MNVLEPTPDKVLGKICFWCPVFSVSAPLSTRDPVLWAPPGCAGIPPQ